MNPCWETLFIFTGKGYAHQRVSPVNGIQIVEYFSAGCFVLNEENECSALVDMFICHIGESLKVVFPRLEKEDDTRVLMFDVSAHINEYRKTHEINLKEIAPGMISVQK